MNNQTMQEFWAEVKEERAKIEKVCSEKKSKQPKDRKGNSDGTCYIISVRHRDRGVNSGNIVNASIRMAGQRITETTHRLCTDDEIEQYLAEQREVANEIRRVEIAKKMSFVQNVGAVAQDYVAGNAAATTPVAA